MKGLGKRDTKVEDYGLKFYTQVRKNHSPFLCQLSSWKAMCLFLVCRESRAAHCLYKVTSVIDYY